MSGRSRRAAQVPSSPLRAARKRIASPSRRSMLLTASAISSRERTSGDTSRTSTRAMLLASTRPPGRIARSLNGPPRRARLGRRGAATYLPTRSRPSSGAGATVGATTKEDVMESLGKAAVAEFVATFALIFVGAGAVIVASSGQLDLVGVALAHGLVLAI